MLHLSVNVSSSLCFVQLRNRLNVQHGNMLKAQQRSLLVRQQHKDAVVQNIAALQQSATSPVFTDERREMQRTNVENVKSDARVAEVDENISSVSPGAETSNADNAGLSQAPNVHKPLVLKPKAYLRGSFNNAESSGRKITSDVPGYSRRSASQCTADSSERHSSTSQYGPAVTENNSQIDSDNSSTSHSYVLSPLTVDNSSGNQPVKSSGTESGLPLVYMPPLTVSVTDTHNPVLKCQSRSPHYFGKSLSPCNSTAVSRYDVGAGESSEEIFNSHSLPLKTPNCVFASKSVIANTYLSRRPPVFSPVHTGPHSDADGKSAANSQTDNSSTHFNHSATAHSTNCATWPPTAPTYSKRPLTAGLSETALSSQIVALQLSNNKGQYLPFSSSVESHEASSSSVGPLVSQTVGLAVTSNSVVRSLSASSNESLFAHSQLTDSVASSNSLPAVITCESAFVPFRASSVADVSSVSLSPVKGTYPPTRHSSYSSVDRDSEKQLSETTHSSDITAHIVPQVLASLSVETSSFLDRFSSSKAAGSPSYTAAVLSTDLVTVSALSEISNVSQPVGSSETHPSEKSVKNQPALTLPSVCYTMPCVLTISTHIPVSSPITDTVIISAHTTSSSVVDNTVITVSAQSCSTTNAVDIQNSLSLSASHILPSSEASCDLIDEVHDRCSLQDMQNMPCAPCTSSPRMTRRRPSADGGHASPVSSPSHATVQKPSNDSLEQANIVRAVDKTAEERASGEQKSAVDSVATESSEVEADASFDDASSDIVPLEGEPDPLPVVQTLVTKQKRRDGLKNLQRVSFSPLALLLDASLEGDLELVMNTAKKVY